MAGPVQVCAEAESCVSALHPPRVIEGGPVRIAFELAEGAPGSRLAIYDVRGRFLWSKPLAGVPGAGEVEWDRTGGRGARIARGVYWIHLEAGRPIASHKFVLR